MTVITLTTVGYREISDPSAVTKVFIVLYLVTGLGIFLYGIAEIGEMVVRAELHQWWRKRYMLQEIQALRDHYIVCGFGRMGQMLCRHLAGAGVPFVAVDRNEESLELCEQMGWPAIVGDATDDRTLIEAGVERAKGLATVLTSDADNLFVVLSAKLISRPLRVIARAYDEKGVEKMQRAGADQVVSLYASGATKMARLLTNPRLGDFFEIIAEGGMTMDLAEIPVTSDASFANKQLLDTTFRREGIMIVGIRQADGKILLPPAGTTVIRPGDHLFALGDKQAIAILTAPAQVAK
jgi:voltage-gated potassium channel